MVSSQRDLALSCGLDQPSAGCCPEPGGSHNSLASTGTALCWNIAEQYNTTTAGGVSAAAGLLMSGTWPWLLPLLVLLVCLCNSYCFHDRLSRVGGLRTCHPIPAMRG